MSDLADQVAAAIAALPFYLGSETYVSRKSAIDAARNGGVDD